MNFLGSKGFKIQFSIKEKLLRDSPEIKKLIESAVEVVILPDKFSLWSAFKILKRSNILITSSESNAGPHRYAHKLVLIANLLKVKTITFQHGYENIGLTYTDSEYPIEKVKFASNHILTWGNKLSALIPQKTKRKCVLAGVPFLTSSDKATYLKHSNFIVIFENLHWSRYSEYYKNKFLELLHLISDKYPNMTFLIKSHIAGQWISSIPQDQLPTNKNIIIIDSHLSEMVHYTASALISKAIKVISTPSTICIETALHNKTICLLDFDNNITNYEFTEKCSTIEEVINFVENKTEPYKQLDVNSHTQFLYALERMIVSSKKWSI